MKCCFRDHQGLRVPGPLGKRSLRRSPDLLGAWVGGVGAQSSPHSHDPHSACPLGSSLRLWGTWARQKGRGQLGLGLGD